MTPALSVVMPVWAFTPELAAMTAQTLAQLRAVSAIPTEVIVVDNGSIAHTEVWPVDVRHRFAENLGIAPAYNAGLRLASAPIVAFLSNDCHVEPGWDTALVQCAAAGRHLAFPWTNGVQSDGVGVTAWCFVLARALAEEVGGFDETFVPAWYEDTDFFHRLMLSGVHFWSVPAARVQHQRLTTTGQAPWASRGDWLHWANRFRYAWKHGVPPDQAPPFWRRPVPLWPEA